MKWIYFYFHCRLTACFGIEISIKFPSSLNFCTSLFVIWIIFNPATDLPSYLILISSSYDNVENRLLNRCKNNTAHNTKLETKYEENKLGGKTVLQEV